MEWLHTFVNEVNARFVQNELEQQGITTTFEPVESEGQQAYQLWVHTRNFADAKLAIVEMNLDESLPSPESEGQLANTVDWMNNMYNPGHYLTHTLPPAQMRPGGHLALGSTLIVAVLCSMLIIPGFPWPWRVWALMGGFLAVGIYLLTVGWRLKKSQVKNRG